MPPTRSTKRRPGGKARQGATVAKKFLAACNGEEIFPALSKHDQQVEYIEAAIQRLTQTVDAQCDNIQEEQAASIQVLLRARTRARSSIPKMYRDMKLVEYCERVGEDYDAVLFAALTPQQREELLARGGGEVESVEENDENDPGTTVKGRQLPVQGAQTPSAGSRQNGHPLRSARKGNPPQGPAAPASERPLRSSRAASRAANMEARNVPTTSGKGKRKKVVGASASASAVKQRKAGPVLLASEKSSGADDASSVVMGESGLPLAVIVALREHANPDHTVYDHLDAIIQPRIDAVPRLAQERCGALRRKLENASAMLRAKIPGNPQAAGNAKGRKKKDTEEDEGKDLDAAAAEDEAKEAVGARGPANLSLSAKGGPYDGSVFEVTIEEDDEPRMLGRSTGKKFKLNGFSLRKDSEVSISHGKFELSGGKVTFTDVGSTNGTEVDGEQVEQWTTYEMTTGSKLLIGQSEYTVTVTWE